MNLSRSARAAEQTLGIPSRRQAPGTRRGARVRLLYRCRWRSDINQSDSPLRPFARNRVLADRDAYCLIPMAMLGDILIYIIRH